MLHRKLCLIFNAAPKYREAIYKLIDENYDCDWYFGPAAYGIKELDYTLLATVHHYKTCGNPRFLYWQRDIITLLFKKKYDIFLMTAESRSLTDYFFFFLGRILRKKIFVWTHGWYGKETKFESVLKRWLFRQVNGIFVYGNYARNLMIANGLDSDRIHVIHNSLDHKKHVGIRAHLASNDVYERHFHNNDPTIIFIGRLTREKNLSILMQAVSILKGKGESYNLVFVGDGTEKSTLQRLAQEYKMEDRVWFYGPCYDEEINANLIYNADICVSPGNVGLTAIHVMTFGCPVITHDCYKFQCPEFEAVRPGKTGDFFEMGNIESLVQSISEWFGNNKSKREYIRSCCYEEVDNNWTPEYQFSIIKQNLM